MTTDQILDCLLHLSRNTASGANTLLDYWQAYGEFREGTTAWIDTTLGV